MSHHNKTDLKAFEARLAALHPRENRPSPFGRGAGSEGQNGGESRNLAAPSGAEVEGPEDGVPSLPTLIVTPEPPRTCSNPSGHRFLCVYCGAEATHAARRRWPLTTAVATAAALAAVLLVMLVAPRHSQLALVGRVAESTAQQPPAHEQCVNWSAGEPLYLALRDQVLSRGVDSWQSPRLPAAATTEPPLAYRQELDRLLSQDDRRGS